MPIEEIIKDLYSLNEKQRVGIKLFMQDLVNECINKNVKDKKDYMFSYTFYENTGIPTLGLTYVDHKDPRYEENFYKYSFLESHELITYDGKDYQDAYSLVITIKDTAKLISLNQTIKEIDNNTRFKQAELNTINNNSATKELSFDNTEEHTYTMTYNPNDGKIKVNGVQIIKLHASSENENIFIEIFNNPNTLIPYEELKRSAKTSKSIDNFLKDIKMLGIMRNLFFPKTNNKQIFFRNPVTIEIIQNH